MECAFELCEDGLRGLRGRSFEKIDRQANHVLISMPMQTNNNKVQRKVNPGNVNREAKATAATKCCFWSKTRTSERVGVSQWLCGVSALTHSLTEQHMQNTNPNVRRNSSSSSSCRRLASAASLSSSSLSVVFVNRLPGTKCALCTGACTL